MKRTITMIVLSLLIMLHVPNIRAISAEETPELKFLSTGELVEMAKNYISVFDSSNLDISATYYLGNEILIYDVDSENGAPSLRTTKKFYPVYKGNSVIFTITDMGDTVKFSLDGVSELNEVIPETNSLILLADGNRCFAVTNNDIVLETEEFDDIEEFQFNTLSKLAIPYIPGSSIIMAKELNMPKKAQHSDTTCWAACMASLIQKYKGTSITSQDVCNTVMINSTRTIIQIQAHLRDYYSIATTRDYPVTTSDIATIKSSIDGGKALILGWISASGNHVTVLSGYSSHATTGAIYTIMDPLHAGNYYYLQTQTEVLPTNDEIDNSNIYTLNETLTYNGLTS